MTLALMVLAVRADAGQKQGTDLYGDPLPSGASARLGTVRWRHNDVILFAAFGPDGQTVVSASDDGTVRVWEFPGGKEIRRIAAAPAPEAEAAPSPRRSILAAAALSPDGKTIATSFSRGRNVAFGFGGPGMDNPKDNAKPDDVIRVHDLASGKEIASLKAQSQLIFSLAFTANGRNLTSRDVNGIVRIWDWAAAKEVATFASRGADAPQHGYDDYSIDDFLVASPDGKTLMFAGLSNVLQFADLTTGKPQGPVTGHLAAIKTIRFTTDGKQILTQDGDWSTHLWDIQGKDVGALKQPSNFRIPTVISPDGRVGLELPSSLVDAFGGFGGPGGGFGGPGGGGFPGGKGAVPAKEIDVTLFDTATGKELHKISLKRQSVQAAFSPDSKVLAVNLGTDQKIELYDVASGKLLRPLADVPAPAGPVGPGKFRGRGSAQRHLLFSADGKLLAFYYTNQPTSVTFFDTATGKAAGTLVSPERTPTSGAAFSADGRCFALEMREGVVEVFEIATGQVRCSFGKKAAPAEKDPAVGPLPFDFLPGTGGNSRGSGWRGPSIRPSAGPAFALSPSGKALAQIGPDQAVHLWDLWTARELATYKGHEATITAVAFAPDSNTLATASDDTTALLWDLRKVDWNAPEKKLQPTELTTRWQALLEDDAARAFSVMGDLALVPEPAVALLKEKMKPAALLDQKRVKELIGQLDSDQFTAREKASAELYKLGEQVLPAVVEALAAMPSPESRQRLEDLRGKLSGLLLHGERLRAVRAVEVLQRIGTPAARGVLQALAEGAPDAMLTTSAREALKR
jgi:WD40 repeat protein